MWRIGGIGLEGRVVLGPMSGVTSASYREFMKPFGTAASVTEMTSDMGIVNMVRRTEDYMRFDPLYPTGLQIFGSGPNHLAEAAEAALRFNPNIDFIDVNMGCPVKKVLRSYAGSYLLKNPARCGDIIREIKRRVDVPVTAKIRLGWDSGSINFRTVIDELQSAGADAIALHARTREEKYGGEPHYDLVEGLQREMSVPLIISGNIYSLDDAIRAREATGAEGVMVARGGVGNPFLVTQIDRYFRTGDRLPNPTVSQQIDWCYDLADRLYGQFREDIATGLMRGFAPKFVSGCHRCREYRLRLATGIVDRPSMVSILEEIRERMGDECINTGGIRRYRRDSDGTGPSDRASS